MAANLNSVMKVLVLILSAYCILGCNAGNVGHVNLNQNDPFLIPNSNDSAAQICNDYIWHIIDIFYNRTDDPFHALRFYNMIEKVINDGSVSSQKELLNGLDYIRTGLLWNIIVPRGSFILICATYPISCNFDILTVNRYLDELYASNETVSDLVIGSMVELVRPTQVRVTIMANLSPHLSQNVAAMLALYEFHEEEFQGEDQMDFLSQLYQLKQNPDYLLTVSVEKQRRVDALFPITLQKLLYGQICLNQEMTNGSRFYIYSGLSQKQCAHISASAVPRAVFRVAMRGNLSSFNFQSVWYSQRPIYLIDGEIEQPAGLTYNVVSPDIYSNDFMDWKVQLNGSQLVIQSMDGSLVLCAGNVVALNQGYYKEWYAYTRSSSLYSSYQTECSWNVEDCRGIN